MEAVEVEGGEDGDLGKLRFLDYGLRETSPKFPSPLQPRKFPAWLVPLVPGPSASLQPFVFVWFCWLFHSSL